MFNKSEMSKLYVFYFVAACLQSVVVHPSVINTSCQEPQSPRLNWLADFVNKLKKIKICDFDSDSKAIMDNEGRWYVSYRVNTIISNELEAEKLCECMRRYIFQSPWTEGAIHVCKSECKSLTLFVIGARNSNSNLIGLKPVTDTCQPIKALAEAAENFPDSQVGGRNCKSTTGRTSTGLTRIMVECDSDPQPEKICKTIYDYVNSDNWLDNTTTTECFVKNHKLNFNIVEKPIEGYCY